MKTKIKSKPSPSADDTHIKSLRPDPENARKHNPRNIGMIVDSLQEVGAARSIVIDENNQILAGNGTVEAAAEAGIERLRVIEADGNEIIAVRRRGPTPEQKRKLALYDNRTAELAEWDPDVIARLAKESPEVLEGVFHDDELEAVLAEVDGGGGAGASESAVPTEKQELQKKWGTALGQLWAAGNHRILCGDSTKKADVAKVLAGGKPRLMVTDPPYGVEYDPAWRGATDLGGGRSVAKVANDHRASWAAAFGLAPAGVAYVWHSGTFGSSVERALASCKFELRAQIIWVKQRFPISRNHYHWKHEACFYAVRAGDSADFIGNRKQNTVWGDIVDRFDAEGEFYAARLDAETVLAFDGSQTTVWAVPNDAPCVGGHSTQKPVECMARPIRNHKGDVYEPFAGTGSTVVAAEQCGRRCYAIELDPGWVAVILERLEALGLKPAQVAR